MFAVTTSDKNGYKIEPLDFPYPSFKAAYTAADKMNKSNPKGPFRFVINKSGETYIQNIYK